MLSYLILTPMAIGSMGGVVGFKRLARVMAASSLGLFGWCLFLATGPAQSVQWRYMTLLGYAVQIHWQTNQLADWMALLTTLINLCAQVYSLGYFRDDSRQGYFQSILLGFTGAMLCTVFGQNLLTEFVGWELMGVGSYLLVGYFRSQPTARYAASKAMLVTRLGDIFFLFAVGLSVITQQNTIMDINRQGTPFLAWALVIAVAAKSAQGPTASWLLDAMAGPTPASALIHAATMVAAGPYLLIQYYPLLEHTPGVLPTLFILGAGTAAIAALGALGARESKRLLAFSTVSQLGMMLMALGLGSPQTAWSLLVAHAFYKALLFFTTGLASHRAQSGLLPKLAGQLNSFEFSTLFIVGALGVSGLPPTGGFIAKEALYHIAQGSPTILGIDMLLSLLGGAYTARLVKAIGVPRHHRPLSLAMWVPAVVLSGLVLANFAWHPWVMTSSISLVAAWPSLAAVCTGAIIGVMWTKPFGVCSGTSFRVLWQALQVAKSLVERMDQGVVYGISGIVTAIRGMTRIVHWGGSGRAQRYVLLSGILLALFVIWSSHT
ncbi:MAG: hypothetical protein C7B47_11965 [Sulfobacillus thermosulfidooxidans]|uniref:NADH:quinone oxidoreductase/Mrp antiporter transmembrane domain-containing protein n=1 Tax=Sulfobacillus thermosulfidooxidans TaxID=28034 RepID=A0A2T2WTM4_SULTH|nr:MAG: hypothetical protein C7B47_11965 [Sulfobacillus thermosulfidooxidans]